MGAGNGGEPMLWLVGIGLQWGNLKWARHVGSHCIACNGGFD